jgi:hypothetical protein
MVVGNKLKSGMFDGVFDHFLSGILEDHRRHLLRNTVKQMIKFMYTIKQLNLSNKVRYKYISSFTSRKLTHPELPPNSILTGALIGVRLVSPVVPGTCSTHKAAHGNHAWVHVTTDATQIRVYDATAAPAIPVDVLPAPGAHQYDNWSLLQCPRRGDYERTSVPTKLELITSYKN